MFSCHINGKGRLRIHARARSLSKPAIQNGDVQLRCGCIWLKWYVPIDIDEMKSIVQRADKDIYLLLSVR